MGVHMRTVVASLSVSLLLLASANSWAAEVAVKITAQVPEAKFTANGKSYTISRIQDENNELKGSFAKTSRKCPQFCIHPMEAAPGVVTVGEVELIEFLKNKVEKGTGVLIDARVASFYEKGTIPGATHIPFTVFTGEGGGSPAAQAIVLSQTLAKLGVVRGETVNWSGQNHKAIDEFGQSVRKFTYDFSRAKEILLFCNGPWCDQSPRAIHALVKLGYPVNKMFYYRGGMQDWLMLGLSVEIPVPAAAAGAPPAKPPVR